jgi:cell division protease FtsH
VDKVTIIPRGLSLGATHFLPKKNRLSYWKKELIDQLAVLMGGRAAEEIFVGDISSGAQQDISQATKLARSMVCTWGMSDDLGLVAYDDRLEQESYYPQEKSYSPKTAEQIDNEVRSLLDQAYSRSKEIILQHKAHTELMTKMLIEFETLDAEDVQDIIKGVWDSEKKRAKLKTIEETTKTHEQPPPFPPELEEKKPDFEGPSVEMT